MNSTRMAFSGLLLSSCISANAILVTSGTAEFIHSRTCLAQADGCIVTGPNIAYYGGNPGDAASSLSQTIVGHGLGEASSQLSGTIGAPILRATSTSFPDVFFNSQAIALQSYTYTGAASTTRIFDGTITYSQSMVPLPIDIGGVFANILIFKTSASSLEAGSTSKSNFVALSNDIYNLPDYIELGSGFYANSKTTASGNGAVNVSVSLNPGDTVWVQTILIASAFNGDIIDASHTFVTAWENGVDLKPASTVPDIPTFALFIVGLVLLATYWRRNASF